LVVDDEALLRLVVRRTFERAGLEVVEAGDAAQAFAVLLSGQEVDAVVTDVGMPGVSGLSFYDQLMAQYPRLHGRVIFLTGSADDPVVNAQIEHRAVPLLSKGGDPRLVVDAIRLVLLRSI
jgi:CheY-like chemotaxis protein